MKNKIENLIKEIGVNEVEAILNQMKSKVNVNQELKKDFIDLLTGCTISLSLDGEDVDYMKDNKLFFYYRKKHNNFYFRYNFWVNFENKYSLNYEELSELLVDIVEEVLNCKGITPRRGFFRTSK